MKIYLSGGFYGDYKKSMVSKLQSAGFEVLDPESQVRVENIPGRYIGKDLDMILESDIVLAYKDEYPLVYGMASELGYAVHAGKIVIAVFACERIDMFLAGLCKAAFTTTDAAVAFIKERYSG